MRQVDHRGVEVCALVKRRDEYGGRKNLTPLSAAVSRGHLDVVRLLLAKGAAPDATSPPNRTPLFYATKDSPVKDRVDIVNALLEAGADVNACSADDDYMTPLMNAIVQVRDVKVIHSLVDHGAKPNVTNGQGDTAMVLDECQW